eukprot:6069610-Pleurochrysis_carterae.AAC.1
MSAMSSCAGARAFKGCGCEGASTRQAHGARARGAAAKTGGRHWAQATGRTCAYAQHRTLSPSRAVLEGGLDARARLNERRIHELRGALEAKPKQKTRTRVQRDREIRPEETTT